MILWGVNKKLKGLAKLTDFCLNCDEEKIYTQLILAGEEEPVDIWLENFSLITNEEKNIFIIHQTKSNREWLNTLLTKTILEREWKIPDSQVDLIQELFKLDRSIENN